MNPGNVSQEGPGITVHDILFALVRHKWKIVIFALLGFVAAAAFFFLSPRRYESGSKLLVKYVLDRSAVDPVESQTDASGRSGDSLMSAEVAILSSWDLAVQTVEAIGPDRLLAGVAGERSVGRAAGLLIQGLEVKVTRGSNVIEVAFQHPRPDVPQPVLEEFVRRYFDKHLEVHRSTQAFDFVSQQKDLVRARLNDLDTKIKALKEQAGIFSLGDNEAGLQSQITSTRQQLMTAEALLAEEKARTAFLSQAVGATETPVVAPKVPGEIASPLPSAIVQQYQGVLDQLATASKREAELLAIYTDEAAEVRSTRTRLVQLQERRATMEREHPALRTVPATRVAESGKTVDTVGAQGQLAAVEARAAALKTQLGELQIIAAKINAVSAQLQDLEAQRAIEQKNFVEFQSKLEKARIDEALDPSKIPNISTLQKPSPAILVAGKTMKIAAGLAAGGLGFGVLVAIGLGVFLDQTIKAPGELESRLRMPMLVSIPRISEPERARLPGTRAESRELAPITPGDQEKVTPWDLGHFIRPFAESIRNRIILGFELKKITHKPKLIGVTGLSGGEGTSTMAGGLAASLSETGDGKVLLVDMNADNPQLRPFFEGNSSASLFEVLQAGSVVPSAGENLYVATGQSAEQGAISIAPRRFYELMPKLRASNFDYIIFDLPPLDQSGATLAISGFMDKLIFMVEAEQNDRRALKRAYAELVAAKADVSTVFNKANGKMPKWALG